MTELVKAEKKTIIIEYMRRFPFYKWAAAFAGINQDTLKDWRDADLEFSDKVEAARSEGIRYFGTKASPDLILKSADPETFKERLDLTSGDKPIPILGGITNALPTDNSNKEARSS